MGMRNLEEIAERLLAAGRAPATPAAVVIGRHAADPARGRRRRSASSLRARARRACGAPAVVVVGDVVRLRDELAWYERQPLFGRRVLVTRSDEQARRPGCRRSPARGAQPVVLPLIRAAAARGSRRRSTRRSTAIASYDAVVFTSANAVRFTAARARAAGRRRSRWPSATAFCVGPRRPRDAARAAGFAAQPLPARRGDAEGLLERCGA